MSEIQTASNGATQEPTAQQPSQVAQQPIQQTQQTQDNTWYSGFEASDVEYIKNKGWDSDPVKGYAKAFQAYKNAEKLLGTSPDKIVKLPNGDDPAEWDGVYSRLGRPQDSKSYAYEAPEEFRESISPERLNWFAEVAHKNGLNNKQYTDLVNSYLANESSTLEKISNESRLRTTQEYSALQDEWGSGFDRNLKIAQNGYKAFADSGEASEIVDQMEALLGSAKATKFFYNIGKAIGEDGITLNTNPYTAGDARKDLDKLYEDLKKDPERYRNFSYGGSADRKRQEELLAIIAKQR